MLFRSKKPLAMRPWPSRCTSISEGSKSAAESQLLRLSRTRGEIDLRQAEEIFVDLRHVDVTSDLA